MVSFETYLQSAAMPPVLGTSVPVMVDAPIVVDATSPKGLRPLLTFINSLECNSNVAVAAAEGKRLGPYFNMMSGYLAGVIESGRRTPKDRAKAKELIKPENLAGIFNAAAERTKNTLTSDVAVLPSNIVSEGPAAHFFRDEQQFDAPYEYNGHTFNFGFLQVFEGGKRVARSSTTFPTFLLDEKMIDAAMPYGIQGTLKNFQSIMSTVNHDMLHHFTSTIVNPVVAHKFPGVPEAGDTAMGGWNNKIDASDPDPESSGEFYEAWSKLGHANALLSPGNDAATEEMFNQVTSYFDDLKRIGAQIVQEGEETEGIRSKGHDVVDYFGTVMAHALSRAFPLNHPLMTHCIRCMQEADPAPGLVPAECLKMMGDRDVPRSRISDAIRESVPAADGMADIVNSYRRGGLDILSKKGTPLDYASLKLLQLIRVSREDIDPSVPSPLSKRMKHLQKITGSLTLDMVDAAARAFDFLPASARLSLASLTRADFNRVSTPENPTIFAVSNIEAGASDIPQKFTLAPVAEVLAMLAQPGFAAKDVGTLVTQQLREYIDVAEREQPEYRQAFLMLTGRSESELSLHMVAAAGRDGKDTMLCVIEDTRRKKCLVIGEYALTPSQVSGFEKSGLTYVAKSSPSAPANIDKFLDEAAGAEERGRNLHRITDNLFLAFSAVCEVPERFLDKELCIAAGTRPGQVLAAATTTPTLYTTVVKLR
ncbi:MAG: hypothetical protein ACAH83_05090 [Alphaproteobacteria bacterium]